MNQDDLDYRAKEILTHLRALNVRTAHIHVAVKMVAWLVMIFLLAFLAVNAERFYNLIKWLKLS